MSGFVADLNFMWAVIAEICFAYVLGCNVQCEVGDPLLIKLFFSSETDNLGAIYGTRVLNFLNNFDICIWMTGCV